MDKLQRIEEMERQLAALKAEVAQEAEAKQWEPEGGDWSVDADGEVCKSASSTQYKVFGTERKTREQAEKAAAAMRTHNRLLAYVAEFAPDYEPGSGCGNYSIYRDLESGKFDFTVNYHVTYVGGVYMPHFVAIELCRKLNSGEVVL